MRRLSSTVVTTSSFERQQPCSIVLVSWKFVLVTLFVLSLDRDSACSISI